MLLEIGPRVAIQVGAGMGAMSDTFTARKFAWLEQCARDGKLKHSAVRVAVVLAHYLSREHGYAWPRVDLIGEKSAMSRSGVHYAVNDLIARGHLDRQIGGGRKKTTRYWPRLTGQKQSTSVDSMNGKHSNGLDGFDAETVQKSRQKQSTSVDRNLLKESTEIKNLSLSPSNSEKPSQRKAPKSDPSFNEFWQHYPKKASKKAAAKAFTKALKEGASPQDIIAGAMRYAAERDGQDSKYTKNPSGWLNDGRWEDEPAPQGANTRQSNQRMSASEFAQLREAAINNGEWQ